MTFVDKKGKLLREADDLIFLITTTIQPDTWDELGGEGRAAFFEATGIDILVVKQTEVIQREITRFLTLLRELRNNEEYQKGPRVRDPGTATGLMEFDGVGGGLNDQSGGQNGSMFSDRLLKTDIKPMGRSPSGIKIHQFRFLNGKTRYQGVLAHELLLTHPEAVVKMPNGYLGVRYDKIDVEFKM